MRMRRPLLGAGKGTPAVTSEKRAALSELRLGLLERDAAEEVRGRA